MHFLLSFNSLRVESFGSASFSAFNVEFMSRLRMKETKIEKTCEHNHVTLFIFLNFIV
jgi:hypothetical protein